MPPVLVVAMPCHGALAVKLPTTLTGKPSTLVTVMLAALAVNTPQLPVELATIHVPSVRAGVSVACCEPTTRPMPRPPTRRSLRSITSTFCPAELKPIAVPTLVVPSITWNRPLPRETSVPVRPPEGQAPAARLPLGHDDQVLLAAIANVPVSVAHTALRQPRCM